MISSGNYSREGYLSEHEHERPRQFSLSVSTSTISASSLAVMGVTIDFMEHLYRRLNAEEHEGFNRFGRARNQPPTREAYEASKTGASPVAGFVVRAASPAAPSSTSTSTPTSSLIRVT